MLKYFLVGEMHGTQECPEVFFRIIQKKRINQVALEFPSGYQKEIDEYFLSKRTLEDLSIFRLKKKTHDGRASSAIKKLLERLKRNNIKIYFVDEESFERDKLMAKNLSKINGRIAFLCGNVHASKKEIILPRLFLLLYNVKYFPNLSLHCIKALTLAPILFLNFHLVDFLT